ncbi:MAG: YggT family protein [Eubacteriales bacterium]|nr:YggT family protein [Eubacteriales bacterium]
MPVARAIDILLSIIETLIFIRVIISWLPINRDSTIIRVLYMATEPILGPIRQLISKSSFGANMMFDFSPIIVLLLISVIRTIFFI